MYSLLYASSCDSMSLIDEYLANLKRFWAENCVKFDWSESLRNQSTDERIERLFGNFQNASPLQ